ncbi:MAG TPA: universal stress protein [Propionibacteriaceae bacterium]|nr:universal stress protein [Propionibacteriaceae bacterium]
MAENQAARRILVGVTYGQPDVVLRHAARFARTFDAALVCAHVDPGRYVVEELPDGSVASLPLDPDLPELKDTDFDQGLVAQVRAAVADESIELSFRELAGDVAYALTRLADILDVEMIIVGSRRGGVRAGLRQFLTGSVAAHLAHRQPRPVVVIPLAPVAEGKPLPWEE